jgi:hypothetical protein
MIECANAAGFSTAHMEAMGRRNQEAVITSPPILELTGQSLQRGCATAGWRYSFLMGDWIESYRHGAGNYIAPHTDAPRLLKDGALSTHVAVIYLNDDFEGGMTYFPEVSRVIQPRRGTAVIFEIGLSHSVIAVSRGTRYSLRVDLALSV